MSVYDVYKNDELYAEGVDTQEASEITGIPSCKVSRYAEQGITKNKTYRVVTADATSEQLDRWDKIYNDCLLIKIIREAKRLRRAVS